MIKYNAKSITLKTPELIKHTEDYNIFLILKTWLSPNKLFMIGGYDTVRKDRIDRMGGGVIILVNNKIKYRRIADIF